MSSELVTAWFGSLFILAVIWFGLIAWLFRRIRLLHPTTFEALGSPSLFWNNSVRNNWLFIKFLFQSQWRPLGDARLAAVARGMQLLFVVYAAGFAALVAAFLALGVKPA